MKANPAQVPPQVVDDIANLAEVPKDRRRGMGNTLTALVRSAHRGLAVGGKRGPACQSYESGWRH